ncbi:ribonuclease H-like domain-containing protein [Tanacetum coccineum]
MAKQDTPPPTITTMKIPIIKKGEYDIWSMRMRQYICHTDHNLWDIIVNGDLQEEPAPTGDQTGPSAPHAPKTAKQLIMFKMLNLSGRQSNQGAPNESLDKAYDRFQKLISQLEVYAAPVSKEDINQKFLRSLPLLWNQIALVIRNKPDINQTDIDDLYNNLRVYEDEMKKSSNSTSNSQNLAFLSSENTSRTNEVSTTSGDFGVNTAGGTSQVSSTLCADEVMCSFFAQQTTSPRLENEDLQQIDRDDLKELDLRWQMAMLTVRVKKFIQKTGRNLDFKERQPVSFDKSKIECYNCHGKGHFARECNSGRNQGKRSYGDNGRRNAQTNELSSQALVAQDGLGGYDWSNDFDEPVNYALMAISSSSSSSSSDNEVQNCSKQCLESFKSLQKNFDSEREKHNRVRLEIQGYEIALESLESRILGHEKNKLAWEEKYEFRNYELKCREMKINNLNMELEKVVKERDDQMSARDKTGLGYGTQLDEMSNKSETDSEISMSVFDVRSSDEEITPANDRFSKVDGYHVVPPPITGNFLTPRADISFAGLDEFSIRKKIIESQTIELNTEASEPKSNETVGKTNEVNIEKPKSVFESVVTTPKINRDKVIIEDWNSDDENDVFEVSPVKTKETQTVKTQVDKIGQTSKKAGIGFKKTKACFVCKSTDHLIKDCDFYEKRSTEPKLKTMVNTGQRVVKPVWDNAKRVNQQKISNKLKYPHIRNTFVPSGVLTRTGLINTVRPNDKRAVHNVSTVRPVSTAWPVSTARPIGTARSHEAPLPEGNTSGSTEDSLKIKELMAIVPKLVTRIDSLEKDLKETKQTLGNVVLTLVKKVKSLEVNKTQECRAIRIFYRNMQQWMSVPIHITINKANLSDYENYHGGFSGFFGSDPKGGKITGNRTKFKNHAMNEFCAKKGIKREDILRQDSEIPQSQVLQSTPLTNELLPQGWGRSYEAPLPEGNTSDSAKDNLQLKELMAPVPKLVTRIDNLEKELKETKQTLGKAVLTLVKKVKSLEVALKRKTKKAVLSDSEDEEIENQGRNIQDIDDDHLVSLVRDFVTPTKTKLVHHGGTRGRYKSYNLGGS